MSNVVTARLSSRDRIIETPPLYQYDYGQILKFTEIDLPATYEVHFGNSPYGNAVTVLGDENGVAIPDMYLTTGDAVHAWLFLHTGENDGETMYHVMIPVRMRPEVTDVPPTPVELSVITQTIAILNAGVAHVDEVAAGMEQAITSALTEAKQSGEFDGFSPLVSVSTIQGGHRIVLTDKNATNTVDVLDGVKGDPGQDGYSPSISIHKVFHTTFVEVTDRNGTTETEIYDGDPEYLIDDSLYGRVVNRTWSIEKLRDTFIPYSYKGVAGGLAELDQNGRVPAAQLPSYVDDVVDGYLYNGHFYEDVEHQHEITGESGKVYVDNNSNITYRWGGQSFVPIGSDLALGETSSTAYRGDRGKIAYDHANDQARVSIAHAKGLYKFGVTSQGHVQTVEAIAKADIVDLGIPGDIQIAGSSIVNDGTANIPKASGNTYGVVKANGGYGIDTQEPGVLSVVKALDADLKAGTSRWKTIAPVVLPTAIYYGLSKLAGVNLAEAQGETVGTYSAESKAAIKTMLGVTDPAVSDVRLNGSSVLHDGVANIPISGEAGIKSGYQMSSVLTPIWQHTAVFYGLSKAAGYDLANVQNVTTGTYPAEAQAAIKTMLGVTDLDVQIAGSSIVSNGVANIPYAGVNDAGVIKIGAGLTINNGTLSVNGATASTIKAGTSLSSPIVPAYQHQSIYYGLSKLAGVDLANETVTIGTYPAESQAAIKTMLGLSDGVTFTPSVAANGDISWTNDGNRQNPATVNIKGPKGDDGDSGVYYGESAPTDPNKTVWIDPDDGDTIIDDTAGSGDLDVTWSADKISQTIEDMRPTPWEIINEETLYISETSDKIITTDSYGNPFELSEAMMLFELPKLTSNDVDSSKGQYGQIWFMYNNGNSYIAPEPGAFSRTAGTDAKAAWYYIQNNNGLIVTMFTLAASNTNGNTVRMRYIQGSYSGMGVFIDDGTFAISSINIKQVSGNIRYRLYGRRKRVAQIT